jgi:hypothetical protein
VHWIPVADSARGAGRGGGGEGFRRRPTLLTGTFMAKLTVNGHEYVQRFTVRGQGIGDRGSGTATPLAPTPWPGISSSPGRADFPAEPWARTGIIASR